MLEVKITFKSHDEEIHIFPKVAEILELEKGTVLKWLSEGKYNIIHDNQFIIDNEVKSIEFIF